MLLTNALWSTSCLLKVATACRACDVLTVVPGHQPHLLSALQLRGALRLGESPNYPKRQPNCLPQTPFFFIDTSFFFTILPPIFFVRGIYTTIETRKTLQKFTPIPLLFFFYFLVPLRMPVSLNGMPVPASEF